MIFDIPPKSLREVPDHLTFIDASHCCPPLPLIVSNTVPEFLRHASLPHPPLYIPHFQLHCLLFWCCCMQENLHAQNNTIKRLSRKKEVASTSAWNPIKNYYYLDVSNQHGDQNESTCKNNDVENNFQPLCCGFQVSKSADHALRVKNANLIYLFSFREKR